MRPEAYYNENDPEMAAWLRRLVSAGHITPGVVDERDIRDVAPGDLLGYSQHHFFAGVGVWSWALRGAGWPDDRPVWTGSCPCQPFSQGGRGAGFDDERHLWPAWFWLLRELRPGVVFGEQVAGKGGEAWIDLVSADLEGEGYACGAVPAPACGFGAPHKRTRIYWVADAERERWEGRDEAGAREGLGGAGPQPRRGGAARGVEDPPRDRRRRKAARSGEAAEGRQAGPGPADGGELQDGPEGPSGARGVADAPARGRPGEGGEGEAGAPRRRRPRRVADAEGGGPQGGRRERRGVRPAQGGGGAEEPEGLRPEHRPGPANGFWGGADWLLCRDAKFRAVEPGTFPLADGSASRVGRLRGYGNALVAPQALAFVEAFIEAERGMR